MELVISSPAPQRPERKKTGDQSLELTWSPHPSARDNEDVWISPFVFFLCPHGAEGFGSRRGQSLLTNAALIVVTVLSLHSLSNVSDLDRNTV